MDTERKGGFTAFILQRSSSPPQGRPFPRGQDYARVLRRRIHVYCRKKNPPPPPAPRAPHGEGSPRGEVEASGQAGPAHVGTARTVTPRPARRRRRRRPGAHARDSKDDRLGAELVIAEALNCQARRGLGRRHTGPAVGPGPGASVTADLGHPHARARADRERSGCERRDVRAALATAGGAALALRSERLDDDGRGVWLAIAAAHLLFVQGAPLEGGRTGTTTETDLQRA